MAVKVHSPNLKKVIHGLRQIPARAKRAEDVIKFRLAHKLKDEVVRGYKSAGTVKSTTGLTRRAKGISSAQRFVATGQLIRSIEVAKIGNGYVVFVSGNRAGVAALLETGAEFTFSASPKAVAYVMMLLRQGENASRDSGRKNRGRGIGKRAAVMFKSRILPFPVWEPAFNRIVAKVPQTVDVELKAQFRNLPGFQVR